MSRLRRISLVLAVSLVSAWAVGCAAGSRNAPSSGGGDALRAEAPVGAPQAPSVGNNLSLDSSGTNQGQSAGLAQIGPRIIKTADVDVALKRGGFEAGLQEATQIAGRYQGFVVSTTVDSSGSRSGTVVIRVPESRFEAALGDIKGLGRVTRAQISGRDVSRDFIDLQARLRNARAQETVLLRLMKRAKSVSATIRVEQHLAGVQLQIEQLKGQLRYLGNQAAMGTITVGLSQVGVVAHTQGSLQKAWHQATAAVVGVIAAVIVGAGYLLPLAILGLLVAQLGIVVLRRWRPHSA